MDPLSSIRLCRALLYQYLNRSMFHLEQVLGQAQGRLSLSFKVARMVRHCKCLQAQLGSHPRYIYTMTMFPDPLPSMHFLGFLRLLVRRLRVVVGAFLRSRVLHLLGNIHPEMRVDDAHVGTAMIVGDLTHTHQMIEVILGDITLLTMKTIIGIDIVARTLPVIADTVGTVTITHRAVENVEDMVNMETQEMAIVAVIQMIGPTLGGGRSTPKKIQGEALHVANLAVVLAPIETQENEVLMIDHTPHHPRPGPLGDQKLLRAIQPQLFLALHQVPHLPRLVLHHLRPSSEWIPAHVGICDFLTLPC